MIPPVGYAAIPPAQYGCTSYGKINLSLIESEGYATKVNLCLVLKPGLGRSVTEWETLLLMFSLVKIMSDFFSKFLSRQRLLSTLVRVDSLSSESWWRKRWIAV